MKWLRALTVAVALAAAPSAALAVDLDAANHAREAKDYPTAIDLYRAAGEQPEALFWLGTVLRWSGDLDGAAAAFGRLLVLDPDNADGLLGDARTALAQGHPDRAESDLVRLLGSHPDNADATPLLYTAYARQHNWRAAYRWAGRAFSGDDALRRKAEAAMGAMWYRHAAAHFEELVERHPDEAPLVVSLGRVYERMGYLDDAVRLYRDGLDHFPANADLAVRLGVVYRALHERDLAADRFARVLERVADHPEALLGRAYVEMDRDNLGTGRALPVADRPEREIAPAVDEKTVVTTEHPAMPEEAGSASEAAPEDVAGGEATAAAPTETPTWRTEPVRVIRHVVAPGDTLGTIAERHLGDRALWAYVRNANPELQDPDRLAVDQVLRVPVPPVLAESGASPVRHVVARGETLGAIAAEYMGDAALWPLVRRANPDLPDADHIAPGQVLRVPAVAAAPAAIMAESPLKTREKLPPRPATHTVERGESLSLIALNEMGDGQRWREIWAANPDIANPDLIVPGQVLLMPVPAPPAPETVPEPTPVVMASETEPTPQPEAVPPVAAEKAAQRAEAPADTSGWGARHWLARLLEERPEDYDGRLALARLTLRDMDFDAAEWRFAQLHREQPTDCVPCAGWIAARRERKPVLDAGFRYDVSHDLDGRADRTVSAVPVRYRTLGWHVGGRHRVQRDLALSARVDVADSALVNRVTDVPVYDFNARTAWLAATHYLGERHTVELAVGATRYRPNDANSIASKDFGRIRAAWDRVAWNSDSHVGVAQGPFLGRGLASQQAFRLFRERRLDVAHGAELRPDLWLRGRASVADYSDGQTIAGLALEVDKRAGEHNLIAKLEIGHKQGRFLDEGGPELGLVFVPTRELEVADRWARPFPFRFEASALVRQYGANTFTQAGANPGDPPVARVSPSNRELALAAEATYDHPALNPLDFGLRFDYVHFTDDAYAYDTVNAAGPTLFLELTDALRPCWDYLLRYEVGVRWDEDPANGHYTHHLIRGRVARAAGRHLGVALDARYGAAPAFAEHGLRVAGTLEWRF